MTKRQLAIFAVGAFALTACNSLTPEQQAVFNEGMQRTVEAGVFTQQQADAFKQVAAGAFDWQRFGDIAGQLLYDIGLPMLGALFGVRVWRGSVNNRKGAVPTS